MVEKLSQFSNSSGGHSCSQHASCTLLQLETCVALCCVTQLNICGLLLSPSTRCTCVMIMLCNQLLDMPHLSGGWIILATEKCPLMYVNKFVHKIFREISVLCIWKCLGLLFHLMKHGTNTVFYIQSFRSFSVDTCSFSSVITCCPRRQNKHRQNECFNLVDIRKVSLISPSLAQQRCLGTGEKMQ